jgi:hypothetical protein
MMRTALAAALMVSLAPAALAQGAPSATGPGSAVVLSALASRGFFRIELTAARNGRFLVEANGPRGARLRFSVDERTGFISNVDAASPPRPGAGGPAR